MPRSNKKKPKHKRPTPRPSPWQVHFQDAIVQLVIRPFIMDAAATGVKSNSEWLRKFQETTGCRVSSGTFLSWLRRLKLDTAVSAATFRPPSHVPKTLLVERAPSPPPPQSSFARQTEDRSFGEAQGEGESPKEPELAGDLPPNEDVQAGLTTFPMDRALPAEMLGLPTAMDAARAGADPGQMHLNLTDDKPVA